MHKYDRTALVLVALLLLPAALWGASGGEPEFVPIQHATFVIKTSDATIFVDPVGDRFALKAFSTPDIILITDIHPDHLDRNVVLALAKKNTVIIGPKAVIDQIPGDHVTPDTPDYRRLKNGETESVGKIKIEAIPMYNLTKERLKFHEKGRGNGYVVTVGGKRIYISGDTEDIPEMRSLKDIDYAFVCMNLPYTMTVEQAASAVLEMQPKVVFPYHYRGTEGFSDTEKFTQLVSKDKSIEVRLLDWYE